MPLWNFYIPPDRFTAEDKQQLAQSITALYSEQAGLPAFYVTVLFHEVEPGSFLVGGEPRGDMVRISTDHVARRFDEFASRMGVPVGPELTQGWLGQVSGVLEPFIAARGLQWELHVDETPRELWMIDGLVPPPAWSEAEQRWAQENHVSPYERA